MSVTAIECEAALSDQVLQAARSAIPADWHKLITLPPTSQRNAPVLALLAALLDSTQAVATALADNAWDETAPIDPQLAAELKQQAQLIGTQILSASEAS